jgi:hypothetical protein
VALSIVRTVLAPVGFASGRVLASLLRAFASPRMPDPAVLPAVHVTVTVAMWTTSLSFGQRRTVKLGDSQIARVGT